MDVSPANAYVADRRLFKRNEVPRVTLLLLLSALLSAFGGGIAPARSVAPAQVAQVAVVAEAALPRATASLRPVQPRASRPPLAHQASAAPVALLPSEPRWAWRRRE